MTTKYTYCPRCQARIRVSSFAPDRVELERERGERFEMKCSRCKEKFSTHVNQVEAKPNHLPTKFVWAICGLIWLAVLLSGAWTNIYVLLCLGGTFGLPFAANAAMEKAARVFNEYKVQETA